MKKYALNFKYYKKFNITLCTYFKIPSAHWAESVVFLYYETIKYTKYIFLFMRLGFIISEPFIFVKDTKLSTNLLNSCLGGQKICF